MLEQLKWEQDYFRLLGAEKREDYWESLVSDEGRKEIKGTLRGLREWEYRVLFRKRFRYLPKTDGYADTWMELLQTLIFCTSNGGFWGRRRGIRVLNKWLADLRKVERLSWPTRDYGAGFVHTTSSDRDMYAEECGRIESIEEVREKLVDGTALPVMWEWANLVYHYMYLCERDKNFGSILFGFGRRKPQDIRDRINVRLGAVAHDYTQPWLESATRWAWILYCEDYPISEEESNPF